MRSFELADFLTASGVAMGVANLRLAQAAAPALLREFTLSVQFSAAFCLSPAVDSLSFTGVSRPNLQQAAMMAGSANVRIDTTFIAAPSLIPPPVGAVFVPPETPCDEAEVCVPAPSGGLMAPGGAREAPGRRAPMERSRLGDGEGTREGGAQGRARPDGATGGGVRP